MRYVATKEFTRISESAGTIQNTSPICTVEVSDKAEAGSGILLYPKEKITVRGSPIYIRCISGAAYVNVVTFVVVGEGGSSSSTDDDTQLAADTDADNVIDDSWDGDYTPNPDVDPVIDDMWNSDGGDDTGDGFSDDMDDIFNP